MSGTSKKMEDNISNNVQPAIIQKGNSIEVLNGSESKVLINENKIKRKNDDEEEEEEERKGHSLEDNVFFAEDKREERKSLEEHEDQANDTVKLSDKKRNFEEDAVNETTIPGIKQTETALAIDNSLEDENIFESDNTSRKDTVKESDKSEAILGDIAAAAGKNECSYKLSDEQQEKIETVGDMAAKTNGDAIGRERTPDESQPTDNKSAMNKKENDITYENDDIAILDNSSAEKILNTNTIEAATQEEDTENNPQMYIVHKSKIEILNEDKNKSAEIKSNSQSPNDDIDKCEKYKDPNITETDKNKSSKSQIGTQLTQTSNKEFVLEQLKDPNIENMESKSESNKLENRDNKTEALKDSNSSEIGIDISIENKDSTSKTGLVTEAQDKIKAQIHSDCTNDGESHEDNEESARSVEEVTEVIEIEDDDDEMQSKKDVAKIANEKSKDDISNEIVLNKDQNFHCSEEDSVAANCAKMHKTPLVFYNKECINFECPKNYKEFHRAPQFAMNFFRVTKKKMKVQYICGECYGIALNFYQDLCSLLSGKQPILLRDIASKKQEFVEIFDSSDEEDNSKNENENKDNENTSFSKADLILIETELENAIRNTYQRVEIQNQLTWSKTIFTERVQKLQEELEYIDAELHDKQILADKMYNNLYESGKYRISTLAPLDLDSENIDQIPPHGEIERPPIKLGEFYYAAKKKAIASWVPCKTVEQLDVTQMGSQKNVPNFKVEFLNTQYQTYKNLSAKLIAYYNPPSVRLSVGQRVIAYFDGTTLSPRDKDKCIVQSAFYPGIIAEEMKPNNFFRYLIFYDDGYTQYVSHKDVRLVCHVAKNVWEDVDQSSREFIQKYIMEYRVNRPMVQTHKGQKMATESSGRWVPARVIDIDCSLVRMQFEGPNKNHKEWIYRGSLRLNPVYMEYQKSKNSQTNQMPISRLPRRTEPFIRYTEDEENIRGSLGAQRNANRSDTPATANQTPKVRHLNANTIYLEDENKPKGKVIYYTAKRHLPTKTYESHKCGPECLIVVPHNLNGYSPLAKPLLSGWERMFLRYKAKKSVFYRAPCGKSFRDMKELHQYLRKTENNLNVDSFDFYPETSCLAEFEAENINLRKRDISNGQEKMPLPLVNYYDDTLPECTYSAKVIPTEGVNINTNPDFLVCCDCEDDCVDKEKCACWQLTIEGVRCINHDVHVESIGYQYKRLYEHLPTGIYECNSRCKCKSHCINRVVQHSLEMKLQVFKTSNRGWGLRCLNDIPRGSFVCIYAGNLLTEANANEGGLDTGDEYFAELDYIETAEQLKEGYESDVEMPDDEDDEEPYLPDDDDDFRPGRSFLNRSKRSQRQSSGEGERTAINFNPNVVIEDDTKKKRPSVRQLFGKDETVFIMDAKVTGNLGRYFNHSCSPNLFVQNVFVDTHDLRFPWVAFFSLTHIRAGTELTWNYNYEVGVVPGKVLYCQCGAPNCRQRLL